MAVNTIEYPSLDEIVFESRHKGYGAYRLRKGYHQRVVSGLLITTGVCLLLISISTVKAWLGWTKEKTKSGIKGAQIIVLPPPPVVIPLPADPTPPQPRVKTRRANFVPLATVEKVEDVSPTLEKTVDLSAVLGTTPQAGADPDFSDVRLSEDMGEADKPPDLPIVGFAEQMPEFPGGLESLVKYLSKHLRYPAIAQRLGVSGKVFVQFVVDREGNISDVQVIRGISKECDEEAVRVVKAMPAWKPGKQNGNPVAVRFVFPILFQINE